MKLWLLEPSDNLSSDDNPWEPWYDKTFGFVVRAGTEEAARLLCNDAGSVGRMAGVSPEGVWTNPRYVICVELTAEGEPGIILQDEHDA